MNSISRDFISEEPREYGFKLGSTIASALSGFIAGVIVTGIVWYVMALAGE
ncbi:MAG: hypothetical protein UX07_C0025G0005 [Parcubacteria group bacterium GW2011_GWA2_45_30]|nr:MAG: hypothetical protein UX07_C0025G0005 [Parcubacteria group bacterium GW2011_GWA2_45_30]